MTHSANVQTKAKAVKETWGKRCDILLFVSDDEEDSLPSIPLNLPKGRDHLSNKTFTAFQYIYTHYATSADWFLKADDDTYVIMENLRHFLQNQDWTVPVYFGHRYRPWVNQGYFSGGAGYVISREGLRRFGTRNPSVKACQARFGGAEDVAFGKCMEYLSIKTGESRDINGRSR
jgi:glycoprotein-N-acetylgalactosamine 3-beta-galactosyltransferase